MSAGRQASGSSAWIGMSLSLARCKPDIPDHRHLLGPASVRQGFDQEANVRPMRITEGGLTQWLARRGWEPRMLRNPYGGSAFDTAGKGVAKPVATFWTAC